MRFAGEEIQRRDSIFNNPGDYMNEPDRPGINPGSLQRTPEMTPGRSFDSPYQEEYLRDRHIQRNPGSGITQMTAPQPITEVAQLTGPMVENVVDDWMNDPDDNVMQGIKHIRIRGPLYDWNMMQKNNPSRFMPKGFEGV